MVMWLFIRAGWQFPALGYFGMSFWHAHEMIFGYSVAVIAGFLLTAIKNWTGVSTAQGRPLMLLSGLWLLGRLIWFVPGLSKLLLVVMDCSFLFVLIYFVGHPLVKTGNKRNYVMVVLVSILALLNLLFHLSLLNGQLIWAQKTLLLSLFLILLLITKMAGRVFPMFSQNGVDNRYQAKVYPKLELILPFMLLVFVFSWLMFPAQSLINGLLAVINMLLHGWRLVGWYNPQIWRKPLVWVLHVGYGFLVVGLAYMAVAAWFPWLQLMALHAFAVGGLALITLGMMARVSLGHTGRNLHQPPKVLGYCFGLLVCSALIRVVLPLFNALPYSQLVLFSGVFWVAAYLLFLMHYLPFWIRPRLDGKPG